MHSTTDLPTSEQSKLHLTASQVQVTAALQCMAEDPSHGWLLQLLKVPRHAQHSNTLITSYAARRGLLCLQGRSSPCFLFCRCHTCAGVHPSNAACPWHFDSGNLLVFVEHGNVLQCNMLTTNIACLQVPTNVWHPQREQHWSTQGGLAYAVNKERHRDSGAVYYTCARN